MTLAQPPTEIGSDQGCVAEVADQDRRVEHVNGQDAGLGINDHFNLGHVIAQHDQVSAVGRDMIMAMIAMLMVAMIAMLMVAMIVTRMIVIVLTRHCRGLLFFQFRGRLKTVVSPPATGEREQDRGGGDPAKPSYHAHSRLSFYLLSVNLTNHSPALDGQVITSAPGRPALWRRTSSLSEYPLRYQPERARVRFFSLIDFQRVFEDFPSITVDERSVHDKLMNRCGKHPEVHQIDGANNAHSTQLRKR